MSTCYPLSFCKGQGLSHDGFIIRTVRNQPLPAQSCLMVLDYRGEQDSWFDVSQADRVHPSLVC